VQTLQSNVYYKKAQADIIALGLSNARLTVIIAVLRMSYYPKYAERIILSVLSGS